MHFELNKDNLILVNVSGSQAYGLATEQSDLDVKGICIPPKKIRDSLYKTFDQVENNSIVNSFLRDKEKQIVKNCGKEPESVIYSLAKYMKLATDCNPNIIELLFIDEDDILYQSDIYRFLRKNRDEFISKKARFTFSGYAYAQIKRIKSHRHWILNPVLKCPERKDYNLPEVSTAQLEVANALIRKEISTWCFDDFQLPRELQEDLKERTADKLNYTLLSLNAKCDLSELYDRSNIERAAMIKIGFNDNLLDLLFRENLYRRDLSSFKQYENWKATRNPVRAKLEEKYGYDCYSEDTEFLTEDGWKTYDEIDNRKLATLNRFTHEIEYQNYIDRFDDKFDGNMYRFKAYHTDVYVTDNHKIYQRETQKNTGKKFEFKLKKASELTNCFTFLNRINPQKGKFVNKIENIDSELYLKLMGWYISEGSVAERLNDGTVSSLSISQLENGRVYKSIHENMGLFSKNKLTIREYSFYRKNRNEITWTIPNRKIANKIATETGIGCKNKRIPRWVYSLPKEQMEILLDSMIEGDGTHSRPHNAIIYYTSSEQLANDTQELAFLCGFETSKYGKYESVSKTGVKCDMYHVHINKTARQERTLARAKNMKKYKVENQRIVCFEVPNGILITRRNGHVGIHGNSKHGTHVVRLLRMGKEILEGKGVIVKRPDREELLSIRNGAWTYDQLLEYAEKMQKDIEELYKKSTIKHSPDKEKIDAIYYLCLNAESK